MTSWVVSPGRIQGQIRLPPDKSIAQRALLLSGIADGTSRIRLRPVSAGVVDGPVAARTAIGEDICSALDALSSLGVKVDERMEGQDFVLEVSGDPNLQGLQTAQSTNPVITPTIDCGNSGTCMRLLIGLLCGRVSCTLTGDASLSRRPMRRVADPLRQMFGADVLTSDSGTPPVHIRQQKLQVQQREYHLEMPSAQVKTALLFAGLSAWADGGGEVSICYSSAAGATSAMPPMRDHTERMLRRMGCQVLETSSRPGEYRTTLRLHPATSAVLQPLHDFQVPGDASAALFPLAAAALTDGTLRIDGASSNPTRMGGIRALEAMGAKISGLCHKKEVSGAKDEPATDLELVKSAHEPLRPLNLEAESTAAAIDELPTLAILAARAAGTSVIRDAGELRIKESDRLAAITDGLRALGVPVEAGEDSLVIWGDPTRLFRSAIIDSGGDHRIAMAFALAGLCSDGQILIKDTECTETSFPDFAQHMRALGARIEVQPA